MLFSLRVFVMEISEALKERVSSFYISREDTIFLNLWCLVLIKLEPLYFHLSKFEMNSLAFI